MANQVDVKAVITAEDRASGVLSKFSSSLDSAKGASFALLGGLTAVAAGAALTVKAFAESENVAAQLDAVLKSTAGAAGVTRDAALDLSKSLQSTTTFSDEAVLSAENLLLTFTSIGKDIFPQATSTVLDMATALGEDTKSASIQLGKALQDPILGVTALRRVGVNFNEAQQEVIKNLVETGHQAEAQKLILAELNKEFGGSATSAAKTFTGQLKQLWNMINDVMEIIGKLIADQIRPFTQYLIDMFAAMGGADGVGKRLVDFLNQLQPYIPVITGAIIGGLVPALWAMAAAIASNLIALAPFIIAGAALVAAYQYAPALFWAIAGALVGFGIAIFVNALPAIIAATAAFFTMAIAVIAATWPFVAIGAAVALAAYLIVTYSSQINGAISGVIGWFQRLPGVVQGAMAVVGQALLSMLGPIGVIIGPIQRLIDLFNTLRNLFNDVRAGAGVPKILHDLHIPGFAEGVQNFSGGLAIVGERGPELVNLPGGSSVTPAPQTAQMLGGGQTTINVTFSGVFNSNPADMRELAKKVFQAAADSAGQKNMTIGEMY